MNKIDISQRNRSKISDFMGFFIIDRLGKDNIWFSPGWIKMPDSDTTCDEDPDPKTIVEPVESINRNRDLKRA